MPYRRSMFKHLLMLIACVGALAAAGPAAAQATSPKIAADLAQTISATTEPDVTWASNLDGQLHVKVLIVATSSDATLSALRLAILAQGGSVHYVYVSVRALAAMVPVSGLNALAARSDVMAISPNRVTTRAGSLLQDATGSSAVPKIGGSTAVNGSGVGIAVLDSGIDWDHRSLKDAAGNSRVAQVVDFVKTSQGFAAGGWRKGVDMSSMSSSLSKISAGLMATASSSGILAALGAPYSTLPDSYGHGTLVASVAAGSGAYQSPDSSGVAPGATLFDVRVLNDKGVGNMADVLAGIDWVIQRSRTNNIRVMNLSLAANSTDSFLIDPLARAARSAVAAGIVVVAAAGNAGKNAAGVEVFGAIGSPGNEPSVITVGAANSKATAQRSDDVMTTFSSRGPTRGSVLLPNGTRWIDNVLKPDLVAPGNRVVGAVANQKGQVAPAGNLLASLYPELMQSLTITQVLNQELMQLSGTSVSAPAVAGAAALLLQVNPGLTPPLVKAILQYTAQPLAGATLLQQGAGQLNIEGAVRLAQALRTDVASALAAGTLKAGDNLLAVGKAMPTPSSTLNGQAFNWGRIAFAGGAHLVSGDALFTQFQPIYDPGLTWVRQVALRNTVEYSPASFGVTANTVPSAIFETNAAAQTLLTPQVVLLDALVGSNSAKRKTGMFKPTSGVASSALAGGGRVMSGGFILSEGFILAEGLTLAQQRLIGTGFILSEGFILNEGFILSEGLTLSAGFILGEGFILSEGFILGEGFILNEALADPAAASDASVLGDR